MAAFPDYLPICAVSRDGTGCGDILLANLVESLASHGIRTSPITGTEATAGGRAAVEKRIGRAAADFDLVLVDAADAAATAMLVLGGAGRLPDGAPRPHFFCGDERGLAACTDALMRWLIRCSSLVPVRGCVLIGGRSSRMGRPKHLLTAADGRTWLEHAIEQMTPFVSGCVVSGAGALPEACGRLERVADLSGVAGPLAGIGAVVRRYRWTSWLVLACDLPAVSAPAISWLLGQRRPGVVAVIPRNPLHDRSEPLFAWYDFRCAPLLDRLCGAGILRMSSLCGQAGVHEPLIPVELCQAWRNVNWAEDL